MRPRAVRPAAFLAIALAVAALVVNVWRPLAPGSGSSAVPQEAFAPAVLDVVAAYRQPRLAVALVILSFSVLVPALLLWSRRTRDVVGAVTDRLGRWPAIAAGVVAALVIVVVRLVGLAPTFWVSHVREVAWGFRTAGGAAWIRDWAVAVGVEAVTAAVAVTVLSLVIRHRPDDWHWWLATATTVLAAALTLAYPLLVEPLFLATEPLAQGPTRDAVEDVLEAAGIDAPILVGDASRRTTRVNAFVSGLGPTRRVVLWDNLLERPSDEVAVVVAHELAHREHQDLPRGVLLTAAGVLPLALVLRRLYGDRRVRGHVGATEASDPRLVLVLAVVVAVAQVIALPSALLFSRRAEAAADHRAVVLTQESDALIRTFRGFVTRDLSWPEPPLVAVVLFGSHPSVDQRIRATVEEAERLGLDVPTLAELVAGESAEHHSRIPVTTP